MDDGIFLVHHVSNITVRNVVIKESDNGLSIKSWNGGAGSVTGISLGDIQMDNVMIYEL